MKLIGIFRKIGTRIFASFTLLFIVLMALIGFLGLQFAQKNMTSNAANELRLLSVVLARQVQRQLSRIEESMTSMENHGFLIDELEKPDPDKAAISEFLTRRIKLLPLFDDFAVFDRSGACLGATDESWFSPTLKAKGKPFFSNGLRAFNFSDIFTAAEDRIQLVSTPITDGTAVKGVLVGEVNMSTIYDLMDQTLGLSETTDAFILDQELRFITPGKTGIDKLLESHLVATTLKRHLKEEFWVDRYKNYSGREVLGTVFKVPGRRWYVVVERDLNEISKPMDDVKLVVFVATVLLLVALILTTFLLSRSITKPLMRLVSDTQRLADGDFKRAIEVPRGIDEVAFLADEIDKMRARIAEFQDNMRERLEVSERRRMDSERLAAIGSLAASLAHEIRNPLNGMSLLLSRLELAAPGSATHTGVLSDLRGEIGRLDRLVSDILDFARPLTLDMQATDLKPLLGATFDLMRGSFEKKGISASLHFPTGDVTVMADSDRIKQCLVNLLQNAADATGKGGTVDVEVRRSNDAATIRVLDSGVGLKDETKRRLFDLFFTTKETGTGLGLSTVKKIVDAHGGQVFLEPRSDGQGSGAEARIILPLRGSPPGHSQE